MLSCVNTNESCCGWKVEIDDSSAGCGMLCAAGFLVLGIPALIGGIVNVSGVFGSTAMWNGTIVLGVGGGLSLLGIGTIACILCKAKWTREPLQNSPPS